MASLFLIAGLGNPGSRYARTRHNVGFMLADRLASASHLKFSSSGESLWAKGAVSGQDALFLKPQTFMNLSGGPVRAFAERFKVREEAIIVAYDDIDLPVGRIRVKRGGGSGGHRGVASIIERLGGREFIRVRLGVGRPVHGDVADYVLSPFSEDEVASLDEMLERGLQAIETIVAQGLDAAMNRFNCAV